MLEKISGSYSRIAKHIPELKGLISTWSYNKQLLRKMAIGGEPKPHRKTPLGKAFRRYTYKSSRSYDPHFVREMKGIRPDWFTARIILNKQALLDMAKRGEPRPHYKTSLGQVLFKYTTKSSHIYDPAFHRKIKKLRPDWFTNYSSQNRKLLLDMARKGDPKPNYKTPLGRSLYALVLKSSACHDPDFSRKIAKLAPHWLPTGRSKSSNQNKQTLLDMARRKEPKPHYKTSLGQALCSYMRKSHGSYDPVFAAKIRKLAPHWFIKSKGR